MAVVLGNLVVTGKVETPNTDPKSSTVEGTPSLDSSDRTHTLIINGKEKKIGRKSAYLLDMMTIDDE